MLDKEQKNRLAINKMAYKKGPRTVVNLGIRSRKMVNFQPQIDEFADKETAAYNKVHLY